MIGRSLICLGCLLCICGRLGWGHREPSAAGSFEALAHLFVGGLLGAWSYTLWLARPLDWQDWQQQVTAFGWRLALGDWLGCADGFLFWAGVLPSLYELAMFLLTR